MSVDHGPGTGPAREGALLAGGLTRLLALGGGLVLTAAYLTALYDVTSVVGGTSTLVAVVAGAVLLATALGVVDRPWLAALVGVGLAAAGAWAYLQAVPLGWLLLANLGKVAADGVAMLTGIPLLRMTAAGTWAVGFAPVPVFLSWYLLVSRRYALGVAAGGLALVAFAMTTDAGPTVTLLGVLGGAAALGFGEMERRGGSVADVDTLAVVMAAMVVLTVSVSVVPAGGASPFFPGSGPSTIEGDVVSAGDRFSVAGSVQLSPEVRFSVQSDRPAYWRVGAYDRYTGQGWVRSGQPTDLDGERLPPPPGRSERVVQRVEVESALGVLPAAWRPVEVGGDAEAAAMVTALDGLQVAKPLEPGDRYAVVSRVADPSPALLRSADGEVPEEIAGRYTQLPSGTADRVEEFTDRVTDGAGSDYERARRVERWLETNKRYSLSVTRPNGRIAERFIFDMEAGYCVYYATTMVTMLRTQDIPARFVVGYTTGQQVAEDEWVVRGLDSHAWVEVYFPDVGWVKFDPTPGGPRRTAELDRIEQARENDDPDVDTDESTGDSWTPTPVGTPTPTDGPGADPPDGVITSTPTPDVGTPPGSGGVGGGLTPSGGVSGNVGGGPSRDVLGLGLVVVVGVAAGLRRTDALRRARRLAGVYWQRPAGTPGADVERAVERVEYVLERRYRARHTGETRRRYLRTIAAMEQDDRLGTIRERYEQARYGGGVSREVADETVALADAIVRERPLGRWRRR